MTPRTPLRGYVGDRHWPGACTRPCPAAALKLPEASDKTFPHLAKALDLRFLQSDGEQHEADVHAAHAAR